MSALIDGASGLWNIWLIDSLFNPNEAQKIEGILLPIQPDALYWPLCTDGLYSVKSGYKAVCGDKSGQCF